MHDLDSLPACSNGAASPKNLRPQHISIPSESSTSKQAAQTNNNPAPFQYLTRVVP
jgi:hypothetical protein